MAGLTLPVPDLRALVEGEVVVAFVPRAEVQLGDEVELSAGGSRPAEELKPAYRRWADDEAPEGRWTALVEAVHPAASLDADRGDPRHILTREALPGGDLLVLRVFGLDGPVLSDRAFAGRLASLEAGLG